MSERIRLAGAGDLDALHDLEQSCFATAWSEEALEASLRTTGSTVLLATADDDLPVGSAFFHVVLDEAELLRIAVTPALRRRGLGTQLLRQGLEHLARQGATICHLEVAEDNEPALTLYRALGFSTVGRRPAYYRTGADALLLSIDLP